VIRVNICNYRGLRTYREISEANKSHFSYVEEMFVGVICKGCHVLKFFDLLYFFRFLLKKVFKTLNKKVCKNEKCCDLTYEYP
jgi:hypothetical protein